MNQNASRMLVLELNEAEKYFLDKFISDGKLPILAKLIQNGKLIQTQISTQSQLTPWNIWPTVYTGLSPSEHGIIGFGQQSHILKEHYIWEQLSKRGFTIGVFGSQISYPRENDLKSLFFIPGSLANHEECFPKYLQVIQDYLSFNIQKHNKNSFLLLLRLFAHLSFSVLKGFPLKISKKIFSFMVKQTFSKTSDGYNNALLQTSLEMEIFLWLYTRFKPDFTTIHLYHVAHAQHLYWRAAEPESFNEKLGELDSYYFADNEERKNHEAINSKAILNSFLLTDAFLERLLERMDDKTSLVIITGLGREKSDPFDKLHKPEVKIYHLDDLLKRNDITNCEILSHMNPDFTLNFVNSTDASLGAYKLSNLKIMGEFPLFEVEQFENQLFLRQTLPPNIWFLGEDAWLENMTNECILPLFNYLSVSTSKEQATSAYTPKGWALLYGNMPTLPLNFDTMELTEIYPLLLSYFDDYQFKPEKGNKA